MKPCRRHRIFNVGCPNIFLNYTFFIGFDAIDLQEKFDFIFVILYRERIAKGRETLATRFSASRRFPGNVTQLFEQK